MAKWLDVVATQIEQVDHVVRAQLRTAWRERQASAPVTLSHHQVTTLLRGVIPSAIAATPRRHQHARLAAAMHHAAMQLLRLNADAGGLGPTIEAPIAAVLDLATEAREWARQAQWSLATKRAGVKGWRCPVAITPLNRLVTSEQAENAPDPIAGRTHLPIAAALALRDFRRRQLDLDLPPPPAAEVVDLRQLSLPLLRTAA